MAKKDLRTRLTLKPGSLREDGVRQGLDSPLKGPAKPLRVHHGILFPYTPVINISHSVDYSTYDLVHTNYQQNAYSRTRNPSIQITGMFASQTPEEARYTLGVIHFLRVVTKMHYGSADENRGTPPPVLSFSSYGVDTFNRVPVLVGNFSYVYEDGVDYIEVESEEEGHSEIVQVPATITLSIDLLPQYSYELQREFTIEKFANGTLYNHSIGGVI